MDSHTMDTDTPEPTLPYDRDEIAERFASLIARRTRRIDETGCLIWTGAHHERGYGRVRVNGRLMSAHRLAWELAHGPIARDLCVLHRCDVTSCVELSHLYLAHRDEAQRDRVNRGRIPGSTPSSLDDAHVRLERLRDARRRTDARIAYLTDWIARHQAAEDGPGDVPGETGANPHTSTRIRP